MVSLKISKTLGFLRKLQNLLPKSALITIYKAFVRRYLDYSDIFFMIKLMRHSQKNAALTVTSVTGVLTMQNYIKVCNKFFKN